jgi:hypothetical protein
MEPLELLERLAALVPPPRRPLVAYHGLLAPYAGWRAAIVPATPSDAQPAGPEARGRWASCRGERCSAACSRSRSSSVPAVPARAASWAPVTEPPRRVAPARRARAGAPAAAGPFRHRLVTRRQSRRPPPAAVPGCPPTRGGRILPRPPGPALALAGPARRALESGHPGECARWADGGVVEGGRKQALHRLGS